MGRLLVPVQFLVTILFNCCASAGGWIDEVRGEGVIIPLDGQRHVITKSELGLNASFFDPCEYVAARLCNHYNGCSIFERSELVCGISHCRDTTAPEQYNHGADLRGTSSQKFRTQDVTPADEVSWLEFCVIGLAILVLASSTAAVVTDGPIWTLTLRALDSWGPTIKLRELKRRRQRQLAILKRRRETRLQEMQQVAVRLVCIRIYLCVFV